MVCSKMFDTLYTLLLCWCGVLNLPRFYERKNQRYKCSPTFVTVIICFDLSIFYRTIVVYAPMSDLAGDIAKDEQSKGLCMFLGFLLIL